jgi:hypothetical protein
MLSRSSLRKWFTSNGKLKLGVEKSIERGKTFTITEQHILILDHRLEVRDELMSLLQKIITSRQARFEPIVQPIIQNFLELKVLELQSGPFKVSLEWSRKFMKTKLGWSFKVAIIIVAKLPPNWEDQGT